MTVYSVVKKNRKGPGCLHEGADRFNDRDHRVLYCADCNSYLRYWIGDFDCVWIKANLLYRVLFVWGRF